MDARRRALWRRPSERADAEASENAKLEAQRVEEEAKPSLSHPVAPATTAEAPAEAAAASSGARRRCKAAAAKRTGGRAAVGRQAEDRIAPRRARRQAQARRGAADTEDDSRGKKKGAKVAKSPARVGEERRERGKLTINNAFDEAQRQRSLASLRRKREREKLKQAGIQQPREKVMRDVIIPEVITVQELANRMAERAVDVIKLLMKQGAMHKINDVIDADTAELIVRRVRPHGQARLGSRRRGRLHRRRR